MGMFKDAKNALSGAKDLGNYHGGMPSMSGAFKDIAALSDDRGQGEILKHGTPAKARVLSFAMPHPTEKFTMQVDLEVTPTEGAPYKVTYLYPTARQKTALSVGMDVPVKISPDDPQQVAVQWDALVGANAAAGGDINAVMQGLQNTYAGNADAAGRAAMAGHAGAPVSPFAANPTFLPNAAAAGDAAAPAPAPPTPTADDPAARLKKAQQLFNGGLITAEEFQAKKAEILGDV
jgi:hypothetical protein